MGGKSVFSFFFLHLIINAEELVQSLDSAERVTVLLTRTGAQEARRNPVETRRRDVILASQLGEGSDELGGEVARLTMSQEIQPVPAGKFGQRRQCVRRIFTEIDHKKVKEAEIIRLLQCIVKTGYDFEYPAACASFEKLRRQYGANAVLSSTLYAYMVLGAIRHRNTHELHQWLFETTIYGVELDLNTFSQLGRAFRLSNSDSAPRYWTDNMHYFLHYVNDIIQSEANNYRRTCQKTRFYLGIDPREFGYAIPGGQSGSLGGFGVRGAANSSGKGGGPWRYYNPQDDKASSPQEATTQSKGKQKERKIEVDIAAIEAALSNEIPLQRLAEEFEMDKKLREAETSSTSSDQEGGSKRSLDNYHPVNRKQIHQFKDQLERDHRDLLSKGGKKEEEQQSEERKQNKGDNEKERTMHSELQFYEELMKTVEEYLKNQTNSWWQRKEDQYLRNNGKSLNMEKIENPVNYQETFQIKYQPKKDSLRKLEEEELNKAMAQTEEDDFDAEDDPNSNEK